MNLDELKKVRLALSTAVRWIDRPDYDVMSDEDSDNIFRGFAIIDKLIAEQEHLRKE